MPSAMLNYFRQKAHGRKVMVHPRIVIGVPSEIPQVEKRAVMDSAYRAKAERRVHLVEQAMVAAIGSSLPITEPSGNAMVVDIGGSTTDVADHLALRHRLLPLSSRGRQRNGRCSSCNISKAQSTTC